MLPTAIYLFIYLLIHIREFRVIIYVLPLWAPPLQMVAPYIGDRLYGLCQKPALTAPHDVPPPPPGSSRSPWKEVKSLYSLDWDIVLKFPSYYYPQ